MELRNAASWDGRHIDGTFTQTKLIRVALVVDNLALALTCEHSLELLENLRKLHLRGLHDAELPRCGLAPEHGALREVLVSNGVLSHGDVVVRFNSCRNTKHLISERLHSIRQVQLAD